MQISDLEKYAPPGYFNLKAYQDTNTKKIFEWFLNVKNKFQEQGTRFDFFYRLFLDVDYNTPNVSKDFLKLQAIPYGIGNISLATFNKFKNLLVYVSTPKTRKLSDNLQRLIDLLFLQEWITEFTDTTVGYNSRSNFAETFIIFSDSVSLPSTPSNTPYIPRKWNAPATWVKIPSSSTYYSRGYLLEVSPGVFEIVWTSPISTNVVVKYSEVSNLASLPVSPNTGDVALVTNDGSNDFQSIYFFSGSWRKNSSPNESQGSVTETNALQGSLVFATDSNSLTSSTQPPILGLSKGFGFYGIFGQGSLVNRISFRIVLTDEGFENLGLIVQLTQKIKPMGNYIEMLAVHNTNEYLLTINDINIA